LPKQVKVILDGQEYTITEKRSRENAKWRQELGGPFAQLVDLLELGPDVELTDMQSLAGLVRSVSGLLLTSIDNVKTLLASYAPELPLDDAYDSEIMNAFAEVLTLAFPFGSLINKVRGLSGAQTAQN
jgi:hypothetical protein